MDAPPARLPSGAGWTVFGNPELTRLVQQADTGSFDVAAADARVRQALADTRIAGAALAPSVSVIGQGTAGDLGSGTTNAFELGAQATYQLDLWGENRAVRRSALAALDAAGRDREAVRLAVRGAVASAWVATVAARQQHGLVAGQLATAERILSVVRSRRGGGMATALEVAQQQALVDDLAAQLAAADRDIERQRIQVAILLGRPPEGFSIDTSTLEGVAIPQVSLGMPASLLTRRPDIAAAERRLAAADADIAAARAAMLPQINLSLAAGAQSGRLTRLFDDPIYSVAAALTAPIFAGGRLAGQRDLAVARRAELLAGYRKSIVTAFGDVESALAEVGTLDRERAAQVRRAEQAAMALRLSESRYRAGAETMLVVLDAQRTLYSAQSDVLSLTAARLQASIALYLALGGWPQ